MHLQYFFLGCPQNPETTIAVTAVKIITDAGTSVTKGNTLALDATVTPSNATDKTVTWSSSNESVATVSSSGVVTPKSRGAAKITATAGSVTGSYEISVLKYIKAEATNEGIKITIQKDNDETVEEYSQVQEPSSYISFMIYDDGTASNDDVYTKFESDNTYSFIYPFTTKDKEYTFAFNATVFGTEIWEEITCTATTTTGYANFLDFSVWNKSKPTVKYDYANKKVITSSGLTEMQFNGIFTDTSKLSKRELQAALWYGLDSKSDGSVNWDSSPRTWVADSKQDQLAEGFSYVGNNEFSFTVNTDKVFSDYNYIYAISLTYAFRLTDYPNSEWHTSTIYSAGNNIFGSYTNPSSDIVGTWVSSDSTKKFYFYDNGVFYGLTYDSSASKHYSYRKGIYAADTEFNEIFIKVQNRNKEDLSTE